MLGLGKGRKGVCEAPRPSSPTPLALPTCMEGEHNLSGAGTTGQWNFSCAAVACCRPSRAARAARPSSATRARAAPTPQVVERPIQKKKNLRGKSGPVGHETWTTRQTALPAGLRAGPRGPKPCAARGRQSRRTLLKRAISSVEFWSSGESQWGEGSWGRPPNPPFLNFSEGKIV